MNLYLKTARKSILIILLLLIGMNIYAQRNSKITIIRKNISVQTALTEVRKQSNMSIAYNDSKFPKEKISLNIENQPLEQALNNILQKTGFTYIIKDDYIMIVPEKNVKDSKDKKVTGHVVDSRGEPLIGVNVKIKGKPTGAITDMDGYFSLSAKETDMLDISYIGYAAQEIAIGNNSNLSIVMSEDNQLLNEVVVTALGIKRETKSLTYNVQEMKSADLTAVKDANFVNSLSGKIAGVTINQSASGIGGSTRVVMRGTKSLFGDNNALYVLDGIPLSSMRTDQTESFYENPDGGDSDGISNLNPDDIESVSVLTGAAAAALYGTQGANGVILITTKKGEEGKIKVNYSNDTQFMTPFVKPKFQNT